MFKEIFLYELRYRFKKLSTWVYFGGVFLAAVLAVLGAGGVLGSGNVVLGDASGKVHLNSPLTIYLLCGFMAYFGMLVVSAVAAGGIARDFEHESYPFFFTKPVSKFAYLGGRFAGSFVTLVFVFAAPALGILFTTSLPVFDRALIGPFHLSYYLWPYAVSVIPNLFLMSAVFFGLTIIFRKLMPVYVAAVALFLGYLMATNMMAVIDNRTVAALADPLGMTAGIVTAFRYWTIAEKNTRLMPLEGLFLLNRAAWLSLAAAFLGVSFGLFRFSQFALGFRPGRKAEIQETPAAPAAAAAAAAVAKRFSAADRLRLFAASSRREFTAVAGNLYFGVILIFGVLFTLVNAGNVGRMYDTDVWPVTAMVLENFHGMFTVFILIILTFFAGEAVWRDRDRRASQILDAMPVPDWLAPAAKLAGLALVQVLLLLVLMATGLAYQTFSGYHHYQLGLYLTDLFGLRLPDFLLLVVLTFFVHVAVNNKYLGHFVMIGYYLVILFMPQFGLEHNLYQFSSDPGYRISDMNGYGGYLPGFLSFKLYWACLAVVLGLLAHLFLVRGTGQSLKDRLAAARRRLTRPVAVTALVATIGFATLGVWIYYNTNVLNIYRSRTQREQLQAEYEKLYKRYRQLPQPRIVASDVTVEMYPSRQAIAFSGTFRMRNKNAAAVDTVLLTIPREDLELTRLAWSRPATQVLCDRQRGMIIYALETPLKPGDSLALEFGTSCRVRGFRNQGLNTDLAANGMFVNNKDYLPSVGYQEDNELAEDRVRKRQGLPNKERMAPVGDSLARMNTYIANDADWIDFACTVGTDSGQTALAPGYVQKEWYERGRHYYRYAMDSPILDFYSFLSGRWDVARD
ncbi:MAG TPA: ABC transporter permease, partial [Candidatus Edwardsbacteria bacterium]|nr:ABC transporter permease [Candidatus Edwardsbacteria bacterium]